MPSKRVLWLLGGVVVLIVGLALLFFPAAPDTHPSQSIVRTAELKSAQVRLQAIVDRNRIEDDAVDTLRITIQNDAAQPLTHLHLALNAPGLAFDPSNLVCDGATGPPSDRQLPAHAACQANLDLRPAARSGTYGIAAFASWNQANLAQNSTMLLGPVTIDRAWGSAKWTRAGHRLGSLLKDLTLPILLAGLGAFFAWVQKKRDEKREDANSKQVERQEVQRLLLTRVMELAEQHYLSFVGLGRSILNEAGKIQAGKPDASPQKLFFHLLLLLRRMETFRLTKGGIFFSSRAGERAVGAAWYLLRTGIYAALGDTEVAEALKLVKTDWDYATYLSGFWKLAALWKKFNAWLAEPLLSAAPTGSFWQILGTVDAFQAVMAFEADKALTAYWYNEEPGRVEFLQTAPTTLYDHASSDPYAKRRLSELGTLLQTPFGRNVTIQPIP
jgi:hypothetical protein